jgi:hypothetical protein
MVIKSFPDMHKAFSAASHDCLERLRVPVHRDEGSALKLPPGTPRTPRFLGGRGPNPRPFGQELMDHISKVKGKMNGCAALDGPLPYTHKTTTATGNNSRAEELGCYGTKRPEALIYPLL